MNMFEDGFEEPEVNFPDKSVIDAIGDFGKATQGLASLTVLEIDNIERIGIGNLNTTFQFQILLTSQILKGYSFQVLMFGYDISIYPTFLRLSSDIGEELGVVTDYFGIHKTACQNEAELLKIIEAVFKTNKFKNTVGGLMKISRAKAENT